MQQPLITCLCRKMHRMEEKMSVEVSELLEKKCGNNIAACTNEQLYYGLLAIVKDFAKEKESHEGKKKIYYISAEFLIGKLLSNNLINLGIYD